MVGMGDYHYEHDGNQTPHHVGRWPCIIVKDPPHHSSWWTDMPAVIVEWWAHAGHPGGWLAYVELGPPYNERKLYPGAQLRRPGG